MGAGLTREVLVSEKKQKRTVQSRSLPELNELNIPESTTAEDLMVNVIHINLLLSKAPYHIAWKESMVYKELLLNPCTINDIIGLYDCAFHSYGSSKSP